LFSPVKEEVMKRVTRWLATTILGVWLSGTAFAQYSTPMRDVENPARTPVIVSVTETISPGVGGSFGNPIYTVPAGKRLVLEFVAVDCTSGGGDRANLINIGVVQALGGGSFATRTFPLAITDHGTDAFGTRHSTASQVVRLYADSTPFGSVNFGVSRSAAVATMTCSADISGHLITL
jgi:hypothetical protein